MAADLSNTIAEMTASKTVMDSATTFVGSVPGLLQTAVDAALANGATADELQPVTDLGDQLQASADALAAALAANTPQGPPTPAQLSKARGL